MANTADLVIRYTTDTSAATKGVSSVTSKVAGFAKTAAKTGAVAAAALASSALFKGFQRLTDIENAEAKLRGLGYSAKQVEAVMANATDAVTGTAYGLGEAATAAAQLGAAGVKTGTGLNQMEGVLSTIASTAAASGSSFDEISAIFAEVAANGAVTGEQLAQLRERGLPVTTWLAESMGTSAQEVKKLASQGKISFAQFNKAMSTNVGAVAEEMGKTVQGSLSNIMAALGRFGAALLQPVFERLPAILATLTAAIDAVTASLGPAARAVRDWASGLGIVAGVTAAFSAIGAAVRSAARFLGPFVRAVADVVAGIGRDMVPVAQATAKAFAAWRPILTRVLPVVFAVTMAFGNMGFILGSIALAAIAALSLLAAKISTVVLPPLLKVTQLAGNILAPTFNLLAAVVRDDLMPAAKDVAAEFKKLADDLRPLAPLLKVLVGLFTAPVVALAALAVALLSVARALAFVLPPLIRLGGVLGKILVRDVQRTINLVRTLIRWFAQLAGVARDTARNVVRAFSGLANKIIKGAGNIASGFTKWVSSLPGKARDTAGRVASGFANLASKIIRSAGRLGSEFGSWVSDLPGKARDTASRVASAFSGLAGKMIRAAGNIAASFGSWLSGLPGKVTSVVGSIVGAFRGLAGKILSAIGTIDIGKLIKVPAKGGGVPFVPGLSQGGITTGPTLAMVGDNPGGREAIIPLDKYPDLFSGGPTVVEVYLDGQLIDRKVSKAMNREARKITMRPAV